MIGGKVIETIVLPDKVWVNCKERPEYSTTCAIYVENDARARCISEGDVVWWQGGRAMWTPRRNNRANSGGKCGRDYDIQLKRIGFSGVNRPEPVTA